MTQLKQDEKQVKKQIKTIDREIQMKTNDMRELKQELKTQQRHLKAYQAELQKISEELIEKQKEEKDEEKIEVIEANHTRTQDSHNSGTVLNDDDIHKAIAKSPILRDRMSFVEIRDLLLSGVINTDSVDTDVEVGVMDTGKEAETIRSQIVRTAKRIASSKAVYGVDRNGWVKAKTEAMVEAKKIAGIRGELGKETDTSKLSRVLEYLTQKMDKVA